MASRDSFSSVVSWLVCIYRVDILQVQGLIGEVTFLNLFVWYFGCSPVDPFVGNGWL
uniref:Uncharacterized protein n=1 Tax=Manihot esculenta TaxID=3983 RepID=A0A2C9WHL7_MANES